VGVVLNLSVWFALHTLFGTVQTQRYGVLTVEVPQWSTLHGLASALAVGAMLAMLRFKIGMGWTLLGSGVVGALSLVVIGHLP
jgi:chromate transporter